MGSELRVNEAKLASAAEVHSASAAAVLGAVVSSAAAGSQATAAGVNVLATASRAAGINVASLLAGTANDLQLGGGDYSATDERGAESIREV